jgi:hypothetical protein
LTSPRTAPLSATSLYFADRERTGAAESGDTT